jgi:hypothetical protein
MGMRGDPAQDVLPIQTEFCKNSLSDGARWYFDPARERMVNRRTGKVLRWNAAIGSMDAGPDTPSNYDAFWSMPEAEIRHQTGKCLDVQNGRTDDGAPVWLWDCHGGPPQRWTMMPDGTIRTPANMCLDGGGGQMTIRNCGSVPQQRWRLSDGWLSMPEMAPGSGQGLCASVPAYTFPPNGANITFDTACGGRGQRTTEFFLHGLIRNRLNLKCVVPPESVDTPVGVDDCFDWESQKWDVYM